MASLENLVMKLAKKDPDFRRVLIAEMSRGKTAKIEVEEIDPEEPIKERCCFCLERTSYWTNLSGRNEGAQVACCPKCAKTHDAKEVPTKKEWMEKERGKGQGHFR